MLIDLGGVSGIGAFALLLGVAVWLVPSASGVANRWRTECRMSGSLLGIFGASSIFFGVLFVAGSPSIQNWYAYALPVTAISTSLLGLVSALHGSELGRRKQDRKHGRALAAATWLAALIFLIGAPIACAWSFVWGRGAGELPGLPSGIAGLFAARYWSLGCFIGKGACGSAVNSIGLGVAVSALAGSLGLALALFVHRANPMLRKGVGVLVCLPMITPPFLIGLGLAQLFGQAGLASVALETFLHVARSRWFFGPYGVVMTQLLVFFPLAYFMILNALDSMGRAQIDAAKFLGASDTDVLRTVTLPTIRDSLTAAMLVIFVETLSDVGTPLIVGGKMRVLATELFYSSNSELASAMTGVPALLLVFIALSMMAVKDRLATRRWRGSFESAHGNACCELPIALRWICGVLLAFSLSLLVATYLLIGIGAFSENGMVAGTFTLDNFARGFGFALHEGDIQFTGSAWDSLFASLACALLVAPVGGALGMGMVWILQRGGLAGARAVESISSYFLSVPSIVVGACFLLSFGHVGLTNQGTWLLILLAMLLRNLLVCLRFGGVALARMDRTQLESAALFGATGFTTFASVVAPLLRSTFVVCVAYGFARSMTMLSPVLLLSSAENQVATTYMIDRIGIGEFGVGMAYGVVLAACIGSVLVLGWVATAARRRIPGLGSALHDLKAAVVLGQKGLER